MAGNLNPIFSRVGDFQAGPTLVTAANDFTGLSANNQLCFTADATNGGFIQRLRFKAIGTNVASVARVFINNGKSHLAPAISAVAGTPTGTPSGSGGTLATGSYFAKVYAVDEFGAITAAATETASISVTGPTGSIAYAWTASTGAVSYIIAVGLATGAQQTYFTSSTNSFTQVSPGTPNLNAAFTLTNNFFYDEISLPATTSISNAQTITIDLPMNIALPPGYQIFVGLGTTVAAGWIVSGVAGKY